MTTLTFEPGGALRSRLVSSLLGAGLAPLEPGTRIGPFRVVREIGQGGLGVVHLAERADGAFEQQVALKLIAPEADADVAEALLARERRLLARLQHPNIARLLDGGRSETGLLWFAMDHVEGERIDRWCDRHQCDLRARIGLMLAVCAAVAYAHARLVVHRDIKPSNILVDADGVPKLLDFGIAAALDDASDDPARRAATPGYASPEQHRGDPAGVAQDIYQLGRLLAALLERTPARSRRADVEAVCRRATAAQAEARYANVEGFAADLRALVEHRPVAARRGGSLHRFGLLVRRHRLGTIGLFAAGLVLVATIGYFLWNLDLARDRAEREARTARRVSGFLASVFEQADPARNRGVRPDVDTLLAEGARRIETELADEPAVMGELLTTLATVYLKLNDNHAAQPLLDRAVALAEHDPELPSSVRAQRYWLQAMALRQTDRDRAAALLERAQAVIGDATPEEAGLHNRILHAQAMLDSAAGRKDRMVARLHEALAHGRRYLPEGDPGTTANLLSLGQELIGTDRGDEALDLLEEALRRAREFQGERHPYTVYAQSMLASALEAQGRSSEAEALMGQVLVATRELFGERSGNYAVQLNQQAGLLLRRGDPKAAEPPLRQALAIGEALSAENDLASVDTLQLLGDALLAQGDAPGAEAAYRRMLERNREGRHAQEADVGQRSLKLAQALAAQERCDEAAAALATARRRAATVPAPPSLQSELAVPLRGCDR